jgi:hypothetical protein
MLQFSGKISDNLGKSQTGDSVNLYLIPFVRDNTNVVNASLMVYTTATDTAVLPQILNIPLRSYIGKPVDSLLLVLPTGYTSRGFMPTGIGYTKGVYQSYFTSEYNNCFIEIFIDTFQFLPIPNRTPTTT